MPVTPRVPPFHADQVGSLLRPAHLIEAREIKIGDRFGSDTEVTEGVKEGDLVATTQTARLDTGVKVRVDK